MSTTLYRKTDRSYLDNTLHMMLAGFTLANETDYGEALVRGNSHHYVERGTIRKLERRGFIEPDFDKGFGQYKLTGLGRYYLTQQNNIDPQMHHRMQQQLSDDCLGDWMPMGGLVVIVSFAVTATVAWLISWLLK